MGKVSAEDVCCFFVVSLSVVVSCSCKCAGGCLAVVGSGVEIVLPGTYETTRKRSCRARVRRTANVRAEVPFYASLENELLL